MKKAKYVLPAIGLISVVAGALAFKAQHRFSGRYACYTTTVTDPNDGIQFLGKVYTTVNGTFTLACTLAQSPGPYSKIKVALNAQ